MAKFDILDIPESTITTDLAGKILAFYGTNNVGKSYVAARLFPGQTLWLATERGYNAQGGLRPYDIETWGDFRDAVAQLTTKKKEKRDRVREMYKCVVVDTADKLPALCTQYIIDRYNTAHSAEDNFIPITEISDIPWGGGFSSLNKELDAQISKLALSGYCVCLIFHDEIKVLKDKSEYIIPKNTFTKAGNALKDIPDFMIYIESQGVDEDGNAILSIGHCLQHKEFFARSRFTECPPIIAPFTVDNLKETVRIACELEAQKTGAKTVSYEEENANREVQKNKKKATAADLIEKISPVYKALGNANFKNYVKGVVEQYLGEGAKVSKADDTQVDALQSIYDTLVDYAEEKDVEWENVE